MPSLSINYIPNIGPQIPVLILPIGFTKPDSNLNPPKNYNALIDTGASCTGITKNIIADLGLVPSGKQPVGGVHGKQPTNIYQFQVGIAFALGPAAPTGLVQANVMTFPVVGTEFISGSNFDVLLGRDVLCRGVFSMSFDGHAIFSI